MHTKLAVTQHKTQQSPRQYTLLLRLTRHARRIRGRAALHIRETHIRNLYANIHTRWLTLVNTHTHTHTNHAPCAPLLLYRRQYMLHNDYNYYYSLYHTPNIYVFPHSKHTICVCFCSARLSGLFCSFFFVVLGIIYIVVIVHVCICII